MEKLVSGRFHDYSYMSNIDHLNHIYCCEIYLVHSLDLLFVERTLGLLNLIL